MFFQCNKRGLEDFVEIGGSQGLANSRLELADAVCGISSKPSKWKITGQDLTRNFYRAGFYSRGNRICDSIWRAFTRDYANAAGSFSGSLGRRCRPVRRRGVVSAFRLPLTGHFITPLICRWRICGHHYRILIRLR